MAFGVGPNSSVANAIDSFTPWVAAADGNLDLLKASLLQLKLPVSAVDDNGYTLLQAAASYGQQAILTWLVELENRIDVNTVDNEGDTALHYASSVETAELLVTAGIDPSIRNKEGKTALATKQEELDDAMTDRDFDEDDNDSVALIYLVAYLKEFDRITQ